MTRVSFPLSRGLISVRAVMLKYFSSPQAVGHDFLARFCRQKSRIKGVVPENEKLCIQVLRKVEQVIFSFNTRELGSFLTLIKKSCYALLYRRKQVHRLLYI